MTLSQLLGASRSVTVPVAPRSAVVRAHLFALAIGASGWLSDAFTLLALCLVLLMVVRAVLLVVFARRHRRRIPHRLLPPGQGISVLVPAYNEEAGIRLTVESLLASELPAGTRLEVIVVDDGSTDGTAAVLATMHDERVVVLHQENAGKVAALHAAMEYARHQLIVTVDGDTVFRSDALARLVAPLLDEQVGAVSGNTKVVNRNGLLGRWQHLEYVVGFNLDRRMYDLLGCMPTVPGAIGAFRRSALDAAGGFSDDTLAEDTDITMAIHRARLRVVYVDDAIAYTEAPATLTDLWRQRYRWCYGTLQATWKHATAMIRGRECTRLGLLGIPYILVFQVGLALFGPLIDIVSVVFAVFGDWRLVLWCWGGFLALQLALTAYALRTDGEPLGAIWSEPLQQFAYRQLVCLVVMQSVLSALRGTRLRWQRVRRYGATSTAACDAPHTSAA